MNTSKQLAVGMALAAALALPSSAMARHGADDSTASGDDQAQVANPRADDRGQEANDDRGTQQDSGGRHAADDSRGNGHTRTEVYNLRGSVVSADVSADTVVVQIKKANHGHRGRALVAQQITVDLAGARLQLADANGDGARDLNDVSAGDSVEVRVRLPKAQSPDLSQPIAASRFKDRSARRADDAASRS